MSNASRKVADLKLSVQTRDAANVADIMFVGELVAHRVEDLRDKGFTEPSINELIEVLGELGLGLRPS